MIGCHATLTSFHHSLLLRLQNCVAIDSPALTNKTLANFGEKSTKIFVAAASDPTLPSTVIGRGMSPTDILYRIKHDFSQGRPLSELVAILIRAKVLWSCSLPAVGKEKNKTIALTTDGGWSANWDFLSCKIWEKIGSQNLATLRETTAIKAISMYEALSMGRDKHWDVKLALYSSSAMRVRFVSHHTPSWCSRTHSID